MAHETDYQRARRQRADVKAHGITGSTPADAAKRIKELTSSKSKALAKKAGKKEPIDKYMAKRREARASGGHVMYKEGPK